MTEEIRKVEYIVADTTAFINAVPLNEYAVNILTVPDVVAEVRNKRQIRRLCVLPFDLKIREPRLESVKHCVEFAKKTGDYASLSGIDIKVIALTYELEVENVGTDHLRVEPVVSKIIASKNRPKEFEDNVSLVGWYKPKHIESDDDDNDNDDDNDSDNDDNDNNLDQNVQNESDLNTDINKDQKKVYKKILDDVKNIIEKQIEDSKSSAVGVHDNTNETIDDPLEYIFEKLNCSLNDSDEESYLPVPKSDSTDTSSVASKTFNVKYTENENEHDDGDCNNEESWITPSNISRIKKDMECKVEDGVVPKVACLSTDYALQNVLKQMNLNVVALNGRIIQHIRTYILRCYACYKTTSIITKVFCPNCGNKTLKRVAVSLDENGEQILHINTRRPLTAKYKNQSLPRFKGGKHSRNPILFEDQPMPRQMPSRKAKSKTEALNEDYVASLSPFAMRDIDSKSAVLRSKGHLKEWARNDTYEEDRRRKKFNRLYK